ncbi:MAG: transcriptional regulator, MarR family [Phycisphaerales bacterium]|nr:transcriptional regulator, MarR family [Phycisphaerales bacterium]
MLYLRDLPKYEAIEQRARRYPEIDPAAVVSYLVLLRVASDVLAAIETYLARHDMSQGRFTVLALLNRNPDEPMSPSDLAARSGVTRATMTGLLDGLEREKFVRREPDQKDRRMLLVELTPRGRKMLDGIFPDYYRRIAKMMGHLTEAQKKTLVELLNQVTPGLSAMTEPLESSPK